MLLNCGVGEDSRESLGLQGDQTSQSSKKSTLNIHWKDWFWSWNSSTLATWCKGLTHWKEPDAGKDCLRLKKKGTTEDEMVGWHHRLNGQEFKWASSGSWWWTGKPGMLQSMGHKESDTTEWLNWTELMTVFYYFNEYALGISSKHSEALKSYSVRIQNTLLLLFVEYSTVFMDPELLALFEEGEWIHLYIWFSPFMVQWKPSQHC